MRISTWVALCAAALVMAFPLSLRAEDAAAAAQAYSQAQQAELAGQTAQAAEFYEAAYHHAPHPVSLRAALRMRFALGQKAFAADLAQRLMSEYPDDEKSVEYARGILDQVAPELARITVTCDQPCTVLVDDRATSLEAAISHVVHLSPGTRAVSARFVERAVVSEPESIEATAGAEAALSFVAPPPVEEPPPPTAVAGGAPKPVEPKWPGIPRAYTIAVAAVALAAGGVATWSGLDTLAAADDYDRRAEFEEARTKYNDGQKLEQRTNILLGATGGLVAAAAVMAIFTNWTNEKPSAERPMALDVAPGRVSGTVTLRF